MEAILKLNRIPYMFLLYLQEVWFQGTVYKHWPPFSQKVVTKVLLRNIPSLFRMMSISVCHCCSKTIGADICISILETFVSLMYSDFSVCWIWVKVISQSWDFFKYVKLMMWRFFLPGRVIHVDADTEMCHSLTYL